ncbi:MAG: DUF1295 domain-containing protein [Candidatus Acidiferrales bacterium]
MYGEYDKSLGAKIVLTALHALAICAAAWILFGGGFEILFRWTDKTVSPDHALYRGIVFACAAIYFARICFATFCLLKRTVGWGEAGGVGLYVIFIHIFFAFFGRTNPKPAARLLLVGALLYFLGSYLNTSSEYRRYLWKKDSRNQGRLYTQGLFRYSRHINYFGDEVLFTGYALIAGSPWALMIPALMLLGFIFVNIPMLDAYLKRKYGAQFDAYAVRTRKFIPGVYESP